VLDVGRVVKCEERFIRVMFSGDDALLVGRSIVGILINDLFMLPVGWFSRFVDNFLVTKGSEQSLLDWV